MTTMTPADWADAFDNATEAEDADILAFADWLEEGGDDQAASGVRMLPALVGNVRCNVKTGSRFPQSVRYVTLFPTLAMPHWDLQAANLSKGLRMYYAWSQPQATRTLWESYHLGKQSPAYPARFWFERATGLSFCVHFGWNGNIGSGTPLLRFAIR